MQDICSNYSLRFWIAFLLFFSSALLIAQDNWVQEILKSELENEVKIQKLDSLFSELDESTQESLPKLYQDYAYWLFDYDLDKCIQYEEKALALALQQPIIDSTFIQTSNTYLGFYYNRNRDYKNSLESYLNAIRVDETTFRAGRAYLKAGLAYTKLQDFYNALDYYKIAAKVLPRHAQNKRYMLECYQNLASTCLRINSAESLDDGVKYGKMADSLSQIQATSSSNRFKIKYVIAELFTRDLNYSFTEATNYYDQALEIALERNDSANIRDVNLGLGVINLNRDLDKARKYFEESIKFTRARDTFMIYQNYCNIGQVYDNKDLRKESIQIRTESLNLLMGLPFDQPSMIPDQLISDSPYKKNLVVSVPDLAEAYLQEFEKNKDPTSLTKSIEFFELGDRVLDFVKLDSEDFKSRLFWRKLSTDMYGKAIRSCFLNKEYDKAYYFMEKNKALLLMEDLARNRFVNNLKLPDSIVNAEIELRKEILMNRNLIEIPGMDERRRDSIQKRIIDAEIQVSELRNSYETTASLNLNLDIIELKETQQSLAPDEIVLEYHISVDDGFSVYSDNGNAYLMCIAHDAVRMVEIDSTEELKTNVATLIGLIKKPFISEDDKRTYTKLSFEIYRQLIPDDSIQRLVYGKKVQIVPDGYLSFLPFEALSTSRESLEFLIKSCEIRYTYSKSFEKQLSTPDKTGKKSFLGIAPVQYSYGSLSPLANAEMELNALAEFYSGNSITYDGATKQSFMDNLGNSSIIHLATHADAQDQTSPWIAFSNEKIYLDELYLTKNEASLVVLSGCNTSLGKQEIGEGVMSLARGFFYSGSKSVVSSLWNIDDRSTSELMGAFYKNLSDGKTKSEALHLAKLDYLKSHSLSDSSPYYWASLILMGENDTIPADNSLIPYLLGGLLLLLIIILSTRVRKKKDS